MWRPALQSGVLSCGDLFLGSTLVRDDLSSFLHPRNCEARALFHLVAVLSQGLKCSVLPRFPLVSIRQNIEEGNPSVSEATVGRNLAAIAEIDEDLQCDAENLCRVLSANDYCS